MGRLQFVQGRHKAACEERTAEGSWRAQQPFPAQDEDVVLSSSVLIFFPFCFDFVCFHYHSSVQSGGLGWLGVSSVCRGIAAWLCECKQPGGSLELLIRARISIGVGLPITCLGKRLRDLI